jgi:hypothetical protein
MAAPGGATIVEMNKCKYRKKAEGFFLFLYNSAGE